ncbi:MAG: PACE efflux transporter [Rhodothermales bacterium]|nr:PACE efflux transporter [Rhodothermales bacterium]
MSQTVALRTGKDRLRYSISFELSLMALLIPAGAAFFEKSLTDIGVLGLVLSLKALLVSLIYNRVFDQLDARRGRVSSDRTAFGRVLHAVGFELTLLTTSLPIFTWWLGLSILEAVATDLVVTSFVVVYTYLFTLGFDRVFPVLPHPDVSGTCASGSYRYVESDRRERQLSGR